VAIPLPPAQAKRPRSGATDTAMAGSALANPLNGAWVSEHGVHRGGTMSSKAWGGRRELRAGLCSHSRSILAAYRRSLRLNQPPGLVIHGGSGTPLDLPPSGLAIEPWRLGIPGLGAMRVSRRWRLRLSPRECGAGSVL